MTLGRVKRFSALNVAILIRMPPPKPAIIASRFASRVVIERPPALVRVRILLLTPMRLQIQPVRILRRPASVPVRSNSPRARLDVPSSRPVTHPAPRSTRSPFSYIRPGPGQNAPHYLSSHARAKTSLAGRGHPLAARNAASATGCSRDSRYPRSVYEATCAVLRRNMGGAPFAPAAP